MMITLHHYLVVAALLFTIGIVCVISRRNAIGILIGIELILNAANLNLIAFSHYFERGLEGQVFAIFVIILAACEAAIALAILISLFANFGSIDVDAAQRMKR